MRISDWSSDVCSSDLGTEQRPGHQRAPLIVVALHKLGQHRHRHGLVLRRLDEGEQIGRASCRERVSVRVDLGGRRLIKKKIKEQNKQRLYNIKTSIDRDIITITQSMITNRKI